MAYPTLAQVKARLGIGDTSEDTTITQVLNSAITTAEKYTGRLFVAATATREFRADAPYVTGDKRRLNLFADLHALTTLTNGDGTVIAALDYYLFPWEAPYYEVQLAVDSGLFFNSISQRISVAGNWGYSSTCPADVFQAIIDLAHYLYFGVHSGTGGANLQASRQTGLIVAPDQIPPKIVSVLDLYRRR